MISFVILSYLLFASTLIINKFIKIGYIYFILIFSFIVLPIDIYLLSIDDELRNIFLTNKSIIFFYMICKFFSFIILYQLPSRAITSALLFNIKDKSKINEFYSKFDSSYILIPRLENFENKKLIKIEDNKIVISNKTKILAKLIIFFRKIYKVDIYNL